MHIKQMFAAILYDPDFINAIVRILACRILQYLTFQPANRPAISLPRACPKSGFFGNGDFGEIQSGGDLRRKMIFFAHLGESPLNRTCSGRSGIGKQAGDVGFRGADQAAA